MKKIAFILSFISVALLFTSCNKADISETSTSSFVPEIPTTEYILQTDKYETTDEVFQTAQETSVPQEQTSAVQIVSTTSESSSVITYISENPDNIYICKVAEKYSSNKANLIAFIKKNSSTPGATVLEFSGLRDANGNLITSESELRYVYDVPDSGSIKRASYDGKNNDGYSSVAAKVAIELAKKYFIPNIDTMRAQRRYEDYY